MLGRDVLSRYLHGGLVLLAVSIAATTLAYVIGLFVGTAAGYRRGIIDLSAVVVVDLVLAFPPIVFLLVLLAAAGPSLSVVIVGITSAHAPRVIRIVRSVTLEVVTLEYVEVAVARGDPVLSILRRDILPNIWTPVLADLGLRLTGSIILYSSLAFLGLGQAPPAADWGLMISENRAGIYIQPWVVLIPAATIAVLSIGANLIADSTARSVGRSITSRSV
jgi:peptide/nickel transport system permease protein